MCLKQKQIEALKDLCLKAGITDADIAACAPHCKSVDDVCLLVKRPVGLVVHHLINSSYNKL